MSATFTRAPPVGAHVRVSHPVGPTDRLWLNETGTVIRYSELHHYAVVRMDKKWMGIAFFKPESLEEVP